MANQIQVQVPQWAQDSKFEFKHASVSIKAAVKASHFSPQWYAVKGSGDKRRVETYDAMSLDYADAYLR